jgi:hypothetical protein
MAIGQNTTQWVGVRRAPKSPPEPGAPSALAQATVELEEAVDELLVSRALMDLEQPLREARYMASVVNLLVREHGTYLPPNRTFELSEDEMSRLLFVIDRVEEMVVKLDENFHAAWKKTRKSEVAQ